MSKEDGRFESKYKPEYPELFIDVMKDGGIPSEFRAKVGICKSTLQTWRKDHPEFAAAYAKGKAMSESWWFNQLKQNLMYDVKRPFNTMGWSKVMGSVYHWSDKVEEKVENNTTIKLSYSLDDDPDKLDPESK